MVFYAYLKNSKSDVTWRYLLTFVNREAADEWWRLISAPSSPFAATVKRIEPQFYVQSIDKGNVVNFFTNASLPDASKFLEKMFFTLLNDRDGRVLSIASPAKFTDHISGRWYFIRSQDDPQRHWYLPESGVCLVCGGVDCRNIHVSTQYRSRFYIQVYNTGTQIPKDFVMIGSDQITISASNDYVLRVNDGGELVSTKSSKVPTPDMLFLFSDLKDRFVTRVRKASNTVYEYVKAVDRGSGEEWELSN